MDFLNNRVLNLRGFHLSCIV